MTVATILVVGAGARQHALCWKLRSEAGVERVIAAPGNPLMTDVADVRANVDGDDVDALVALAAAERVGLVVVGPEDPLVAGLADRLAAVGIACFGPTAAAAQLEASKALAREVCDAAGVRMADGRAFTDAAAAISYAQTLGGRCVVKADGLALGKGVEMCADIVAAEAAVHAALIDGRFGEAGRRIVIEEWLEGVEASVFALCDGTSYALLPAARDHKRVGDGDTGANTGGMGAFSPVPELDDEALLALGREIVAPVLAEMSRRGAPFVGALFAGLMLTTNGPRVLEFNVRFGDPETQALMPRLDAPLAELMLECAQGRLSASGLLPTKPEATVSLVLAADGYPDISRKGEPITGIDRARAAGALVFGAALTQRDEGLVTAGGRVLTVVGRGPDVAAAADAAYAAAAEIDYAGKFHRRDIGRRGGGRHRMIPRYTLPEMGTVWTEQAHFESMLRVEIAALRAVERRGLVPAGTAAEVASKARVDVERIAELEQTTDHDVIAFVSQVAETVGPAGRFIHFGLTSSDVVDTALALQCGQAADLLLAESEALVAVLVAKAREHSETVMMGRTHSVHAEPITFGLKLANWAFEMRRDGDRLAQAAGELSVGKLSGAVGTYSQLPPDVEAEVMAELELSVDPVSTQIVQRDRHAAFLTAIAVMGGSLERFATEIRNLQHTEIAELQEPFRAGQKGSSAMPHKRNPITSERIVGLARLLRGFAVAGMEDQALWHERDISHSSVERVALPGATTLLYYMLIRFRRIVDGLVVRPERMRENVERGLGLFGSSRLLTMLVEEGGLTREDAYAIVQRDALRAADERRQLRELVEADSDVTGVLSPDQIAYCFDEARLLAHVKTIIGRLEQLEDHAHMPLAELVPGFVRSGKVRDIYALDDERLLLVASDRISAFDVVLPTNIPDKGRVLTGISRHWFRETTAAGIMPNHLLSTDVATLSGEYASAADELRGRSMICRRADVLPVELIVRGYLAGSGWKDYGRTGAVCGIPLPEGLRESERLPEPLFTPSTKADVGHDENISFDQMVELVGPTRAEQARSMALALYKFAASRAEPQGIILADTKFEFGIVDSGEMILIDEVLTPDSSRFWDASTYEPGRAQDSYDKQYVRDYLETLDWGKTYPGPELPADVVAGTRQRYVESFERITGGSFETYLNDDVIA